MKRIKAFTLVELLVVIGIIALLISILLPSLQKARQSALLISCQAKMRDFGNSITFYTMDNKGSFPGPCLGQVHAGYQAGDKTIATYVWRYLKLPAPTATLQIMKALYCPGYEANNPGRVTDPELLTYGMQFWDPYPWFGYTNASYFPEAIRRYPGLVGQGTYAGMVLPMKYSQVWKPSEQPEMSDMDNADGVFEGGGWGPNDPGGGNASMYKEMSAVPNHGGKPELKQGVLGVVDANFNNSWQWIDRSAATNPPRNWLFMDGHVEAVRKSEGLVPPPR